MSNATDSYDRVVAGFAELLHRLEHIDEDAEIRRRIKLNTAAREAAIARVRREYAAYGLVPPSDLALSITARIDRGIGIQYSEAAE